MATIDIQRITVRPGRRKLDEHTVNELMKSIEELGLMNPITVTSGHVLIAGAHRLEAFRRMGRDTIEATILDIDGLAAELAEIDENLTRADLTKLERSTQLARRQDIYQELYPETKHGRNQYTEDRKNFSDPPKKTFTAATAEMTGLTDRAVRLEVQRGKYFLDKPEIAEAAAEIPDVVNNGSELDALRKLDDDKALDVLNRIKSGEASSVKEAQQAMKKAERAEERAQLIERVQDLPPDDRIVLHHGDADMVMAGIAENSIDAIITDPPYPREFLHTWSILAKHAARVLKPGGFVVAYSGQLHLPEVMNRMAEHLGYYWLGVVYHQGIQAQRFERHIQNAVKPILVYYKPPMTKQPQWFVDMVTSPCGDKDHHEWGQSVEPFEYLVDRFTNPGDVVLDPFAGGGTTLVAAYRKHRKSIGIEMNDEHFQVCKARIAEELS